VRKVKQRTHVIPRQPVLPLESARRQLVLMVPELEDWLSVQSIRAGEEDIRDAPRRSEVASFFSAALELTRDRALELRQDQPFSDVYVRRARDELKAAE
jgi:segregation and condensation protein A